MNITNNVTIELKATRDNFNLFIDFIESGLSKAEINNQYSSNILLACEEVIVNIIDYGYSLVQGNITIDFSHIENKIEITFSDCGIPFNPLELPETDTKVSLDKRGLGGYGVLIVKKMMDSVLYEYVNGKNRLTIIKNIL